MIFVCAVLYKPLTQHRSLTAATNPSASSTPTPTPTPIASRDPELTDPSPSATRPTRDVSALIRPDRDYLGVAMDGAHRDPHKLASFVRKVGTRPNMITMYQSFGDDFPARDVQSIYRYGALPLIRWEPYNARLSDVARGRHDSYIERYAAAVRRLNVPVAMTFAHEMNGFWYPWDASHVTSTDYVAAWRRIHDIFRAEGATNVIWSWAPNVISGGPGVKLAAWYPGDAYVDWIGIDGYFAAGGPDNYQALFGPTIREINGFTDRPYLIVETGAEAGWSRRHHALESLFKGVADDDRMIGFVYFNQAGSRQWQLSGDSGALSIYAKDAKRLRFGFTVR